MLYWKKGNHSFLLPSYSCFTCNTNALHFYFSNLAISKQFLKEGSISCAISPTCMLYRGCFGALTSLSRRWDTSLHSKSLQASWGCRSLAIDLEDLNMLFNPWINVPPLIFTKATDILILDVFCICSLCWKISLWKVTDVWFAIALLKFTSGKGQSPHTCTIVHGPVHILSV